MDKINVILACTGRSSRYTTKPKWMLTHPDGSLMISKSLSGFDYENVDKVYVTLLDDHIKRYGLQSDLAGIFSSIDISDKLEIVVLDSHDRNQPETVYRTIKEMGIEGPIIIKDVDNYFEDKLVVGNYVDYCSLEKYEHIVAANKSYIAFDDNGVINNIVEKKVVSPYFSVGGYSFADSGQYCEYFEKNSDFDGLYVSHIIYNMMCDGINFTANEVDNYIDWGTIEDWRNYTKQYSTIFVDLDGVIVENSGRYFNKKWGTTGGIENNIEYLRDLYQKGKTKIIITTSRTADFEEITTKQLKDLDMPYDSIIYSLPHCQRIIINDFADTNPYKSCDAININRNDDNLGDLLDSSIR